MGPATVFALVSGAVGSKHRLLGRKFGGLKQQNPEDSRYAARRVSRAQYCKGATCLRRVHFCADDLPLCVRRHLHPKQQTVVIIADAQVSGLQYQLEKQGRKVVPLLLDAEVASIPTFTAKA